MSKPIRRDLPVYEDKFVTGYGLYQTEVCTKMREVWEEVRKKYPTLTIKQVNMVFTSQWRLLEEMIRKFNLDDDNSWETVKLPAFGKFFVSKYKVEKHKKQLELSKEKKLDEGNV